MLAETLKIIIVSHFSSLTLAKTFFFSWNALCVVDPVSSEVQLTLEYLGVRMSNAYTFKNPYINFIPPKLKY